ncbi:MAG: DUF998 domain-containing protein [Treponema sp.]|nr:DUF998 domain-containing protein [Treponema sp.]
MTSFIKLSWLSLIIAMLGDIAISFVLPLFYKTYSISKMSISALGNPKSPVRLIFNLWMLAEGILFLFSLPALFKKYHEVSPVLTNVMLVFIALFAIGACVFTCFFSVNESKDVVTVSSKIHGVGSALGFMLFLFVPLLLGILSFKNDEGIIGIISVCSFVISMAFFVLFVMSDKPEFSGTLISSEGLWQRLNLIFMYLPLLIAAITSTSQ